MTEREPQQKPFTEEDKQEMLANIEEVKKREIDPEEKPEVTQEIQSIIGQMEAQLGVPAMDVKTEVLDELEGKLDKIVGDKIFEAFKE